MLAFGSGAGRPFSLSHRSLHAFRWIGKLLVPNWRPHTAARVGSDEGRA